MKEKFKEFLREHMFFLWLIGKRVSFIKWKNYPRRIWGLFAHFNEYKNRSRRTIYIITTPEYGNLGDHAIAMAESQIAREQFQDYDIVEITDSQFNEIYICLYLFHKKDDLIFLIGGGNFGNKYKLVEFIRIETIRKFNRCKIILFPQTFNFENSDRYDNYYLRKYSRCYEQNNRILLMFRERNSYRKAAEYFKNIVYVPDIVLTMNADLDDEGVVNDRIGLCLRNDDESIVRLSLKNEIISSVQNKGFKLDIFDTDKGPVFISESNRVDEVNKLIKRISACRFIITDRLHGMILSYISGTPCLFIDNYNKKISGVNEWIICPEILELNETNAVNERIETMMMMYHFNPNQTRYKELIVKEIKQFLAI